MAAPARLHDYEFARETRRRRKHWLDVSGIENGVSVYNSTSSYARRFRNSVFPCTAPHVLCSRSLHVLQSRAQRNTCAMA
jgi:hypothetical protein